MISYLDWICIGTESHFFLGWSQLFPSNHFCQAFKVGYSCLDSIFEWSIAKVLIHHLSNFFSHEMFFCFKAKLIYQKFLKLLNLWLFPKSSFHFFLKNQSCPFPHSHRYHHRFRIWTLVMITRWRLIPERMMIKCHRKVEAFLVMVPPIKKERWKVQRLCKINKSKSKACKVSSFNLDILKLMIKL